MRKDELQNLKFCGIDIQGKDVFRKMTELLRSIADVELMCFWL